MEEYIAQHYLDIADKVLVYGEDSLTPDERTYWDAYSGVDEELERAIAEEEASWQETLRRGQEELAAMAAEDDGL